MRARFPWINGLEADSPINEVTELGDIANKYRAFEWNVIEIDRNNIYEIKEAFDSLPNPNSEHPTVIIVHTIKGKGVEFMENQARWHAGKISDEQLKESIEKLQAEYERRWS